MTNKKQFFPSGSDSGLFWATQQATAAPDSYFGNQYLPNSDISRENPSLLFPHARDAKPKYLNLNNKGGSPAAPSAEAEFILVPLGALLEIRKMRIRVTHFCGSRKKEGG